MLVLGGADVRRLLPIPRAVEVIRAGFVDFGRGDFDHPDRIALGEANRTFLVKPAARRSAQAPAATKLLSIFEHSPVQGVIVLFDGSTGAPAALIDAASITAIRTAATSAVATDALADPGASRLAVIGAGVQASSHVEAMLAVRPITHLRIWNRTVERAERLAEAVGETHPDTSVSVCGTAAEACNDAAIVCTTTASTHPVIGLVDVASGAHVNAVGAFRPSARELAGDLVRDAWLVVDDRTAALREAGDLLLAAQEADADPPGLIAAELADVLQGGETPPVGRLTVFKSVGLAFQDLVAAAEVLDQARRVRAGIEVALD